MLARDDPAAVQQVRRVEPCSGRENMSLVRMIANNRGCDLPTRNCYLLVFT